MLKSCAICDKYDCEHLSVPLESCPFCDSMCAVLMFIVNNALLKLNCSGLKNTDYYKAYVLLIHDVTCLLSNTVNIQPKFLNI